MNRQIPDRWKLILSMCMFGTIGIVRRYIPYPSSVIALVRGLIGMLSLLALRLCGGERLTAAELKRNAVPLCLSGVLLGANWILLFEAYRYTSVSVATVCYYTAPVFVILAAPVFLHETLTVKKGLCTAAAVCGMVLVSGVLESGVSGLTGVLFGLGAAVLYAAVILLNKQITGLSAGDRTLLQLGAAAVALLPYVLMTEDLSALDTSWFVLAMLLVAGVVHTGIAYALYFDSIRNLPAQTAALLSYIDPITAVVLSALVLKEQLSLTAGVGGALMIGAAAISELPTGRAEH
ncbi:MAG: DMT family transporter [Oscillospiraceae bacterium]|jgi:RarD protein